MPGLDEIDVERVVQHIRERVRERGDQTESAALSPTALDDLSRQVEADLAVLHTEHDIYSTALTSHRRTWGRFVVRIKNLLRRLLSPILLRQSTYNGANTRFVSVLRQQIELLDRRAQRQLGSVETQLGAVQQQLGSAETQLGAVQQQLGSAETQLGAVQQQLGSVGGQLGAVQQAIDQRDQERMSWREWLERRLQDLETQARSVRPEFEAMVSRVWQTREDEWRSLREQVARTEGKVRRLLYRQAGGADERPATATEQPASLSADIEFDSLGFGERFWGSRTEVMERRRPYVQLFRDTDVVVDLGCGRGEFLELLRAAGVDARGIDEDIDMLLLCHELGLPAEQGDARIYLRSLGEGSLGGIFAAHLIEHIEPALAIELVHLAYRALRPGGLLVLETPNPACLMTFASAFYMDFTHRRPIHPEALRFLARSVGFRDIEIHLLAPVDSSLRLPILEAPVLGERTEQFNRSVSCLNDLVFGPQDYALVARKP
jgi:SAM-dependent methyltransferase/flagellar biosynthesis chaperone FliJ